MSAKIGRNESCECGSGRKYKKCCGRAAAEATRAPQPVDLSTMQQLLRAGRHAELESLARSQLAANPQSAVVWKFLGATLHAQGRDALEALETAARLAPKDAEAHTNLGNALRARGRLAEAATSHRRALVADADYAKAHNNLGGVLRDLGQPQEAVASFRAATRLDSGFVLAHYNLGIVLRDLGHPQEAITAYRRVLALSPDHADAHAQIGNALLDLGRREEAIASYRRAVVMQPQHVEALLHLGNELLAARQAQAATQYFERLLLLRPSAAEVHGNLGHALRDLGHARAAQAAYERALALQPQSAEMHNNLGNGAFDLGRFEEAATHYQRAIELNPSSAKAHSNLGCALRELGRLDGAERSFDQALILDPGCVDTLTNLATVQRLLGRVEEAEVQLALALTLAPGAVAAATLRGDLAADRGEFELAETLYRDAFTQDSNSAAAWAGIAATHRMTGADADWYVEAERLAARPRRPRDEVPLRFAMGKYLDDRGEYDRAFANYHRANELVKGYRPAHDRQQLQATFEFVRQLYDGSWIEAARARSAIEHRPLFVVGMPRSGTSLAEQILASHPEVFGAGELPFWKTASVAVGTQSLTDGPSPALTEHLAAQYDAVLATLAPLQRFVVDKMPANFAHLGMIHAALPGARIIHMRRHPIDTCLSIYFQNFHVAHSYANDLDDLAHYYDEYRNLMSHWHAVLPADAILDVPYEALVADPEHWSRRMVAFAGLPWNESCLESHRTHRAVRTFSRWQVRQKISTASVQRWRRYAAHVGPLLRLDASASA